MWITRVSINNPVLAVMAMVTLCVLGILAYSRLGVEQMPDVSLPGAYIQVDYPGAAPEAVEREVTRPLEQAVNSVAGVKRITSRSLEGRSQTNVEFTLDTDMSRAVQELRDRIAALAPSLPKESRAPMVARYNNDNAQPVVVLALLGDSRSPRELGLLADQLVEKRLLRVEGVARVDLAGRSPRELRITLDPARLRAHGLTPADLASALRAANADLPVGLLSDRQQDLLLRVEGRVRDPRDFASLVVARRGGLALTLADLGTLSQRDQEADSIARVNGQRAITFNVFKQQDANIVATGQAVKDAADELKKSLPPDVELRLIYANSDWVKQSLAGLQRTLVEGALLTLLIVYLFLGSWRSTVITGLTLPISVLASFIALRALGFTLNFMTMMALSLCIGLLIDDAIVVRENIMRHLAMGKGHWRAALDGTQEIGLAVLATTLAICAVFVPVAFMGGLIGRFFYAFGLTVVVAVLVSLFVSFTLDPMLSSRWPEPAGGGAGRIRWLAAGPRLTQRLMDALERRYAALIAWVLSPRRWRLWLPAWGRGFDADGQRDGASTRHWRRATITPRGVVLAVGVASLAGALALAPLVGTEFIPETDQGFTRLSLRLPEGSSLARSDAKVRQVEAVVRAMPEVAAVSAWIGGTGQRNQAGLDIALTPRQQRQRSQKQVEDAIRAAIASIPGITATLGFDRPIYVAILGPDGDADGQGLARVASAFAEQVKRIPGTVDVELSVRPGLPAYAVRLKPDAIRQLGLTTPQLASSLRAYVQGEAATQWTSPDGEQVDVVLRLDQAQRQRVDQLQSLPVAYAADGTPISLASVASIVAVANPEIIRRQNLQRREAVFAGVSGRPSGEVGDAVQKLVADTKLPPGYSFDVGGQTREQQDAFGGLLVAMGLAVIFIYIVLASQFGSYLQPIAIMASLPLALIGVMLALLVWRSTLNVFSMIGLVMLMGLVTKNAILLVDCANQARRAGADMASALRQAGLLRLRPILMTTAAMVFGMLPLALALDEGAELQAAMGRAIIGGVITSTLLTLVVVPVLYSYLARGRLATSPAPSPAPDAWQAPGAFVE